MEVKITTENFESYKNGDLPLVVDLWATWCGPCRMIAPIVTELANEYDGRIVVGKCDVEENDDLTIEFGVRNIPTLFCNPDKTGTRNQRKHKCDRMSVFVLPFFLPPMLKTDKTELKIWMKKPI